VDTDTDADAERDRNRDADADPVQTRTRAPGFRLTPRRNSDRPERSRALGDA
jgi:hypothetical protein